MKEKRTGNKPLRVGIYTALAATLTMTLASTTLAKYATGITNTESARVAKFDVQLTLSGTDLNDWVTNTSENYEEVTLFNQKYKTNDVNGFYGESSVSSSNTDAVVAPGTDASLQFDLTNNSEVAVAIQASFAESQKIPMIPIIYSYTDQNDETTYYCSDEVKRLLTGTDGDKGFRFHAEGENVTGSVLPFASSELMTTDDIAGNMMDLSELVSNDVNTTIGPNLTAGNSTSIVIGWCWPFERQVVMDKTDEVNALSEVSGDVTNKKDTDTYGSDTELAQMATSDTVGLEYSFKAVQID